MNTATQPKPVDYARVHAAALQALARNGDRAATDELARRGLSAHLADVDVTALTAEDLRQLVAAWRAGMFEEDRGRSRQLAERAQAELEVRYRVDLRLHDGRGLAPQPPAAAPWLMPVPPRCVGWRRPQGSTLYPSELDYTRAALTELALRHYEQRRRHV